MLLAAALAGGIWYSGNRQNTAHVRENYRIEKQEFVRQVVELKSTRLHGCIIENTYWDEAVAFLKSSNQQWARTSLDLPAQVLGAATLWVFRRDGDIVHSWHAPDLTIPLPDPHDLPAMQRRLAQVRMLRWFVRVGDAVWEMHGATIHRSNDPLHQGEYFGYLIAGRPCNPSYLDDVGSIARCRLRVETGQAPDTKSPQPAGVPVSVPLPGLDGTPAAFLVGIAADPLTPALEHSTQQALVIFAVFTFSIFGLSLFVLTRWLHVPIRLLSEALLHRDPARLAPLLPERTEFGFLAQFIATFFRQERSLRASHVELERRIAERTAELEHRAYHDSLTGLANRARFGERLEAALAQVRLPDSRLAVLFVDLDNFKVVNDSLGHEVGDSLLYASARRMEDIVHSPDCLVRLGGDEFAILLEDTTEAGAIAVADRIAEMLKVPFLVDGHTLTTTASIGVALGDEGEAPGDLLRNADIAMYRAKERGRTLGQSSSVVFTVDMRREADERLAMEADLRNALQRPNEEFYLVFQPIYDLQRRRVAGLEALLRWQTTNRGSVPPGRFIPLAEETGLIHDLTNWALQEACRSYMTLLNRLPHSLHPNFLSVNISVICLQSEGVVDRILTSLREEGLSPTQLGLEVTESVMARQLPTVQNALSELRATGVRIMMDDFGTGYSSMATLTELPVDMIKIDQAFVGRLEERPETGAILQAMVGLATALDLDLVCEGIERREQHDLITPMGKLYGQGFLFAPALPLDDVEQLLLATSP